MYSLYIMSTMYTCSWKIKNGVFQCIRFDRNIGEIVMNFSRDKYFYDVTMTLPSKQNKLPSLNIFLQFCFGKLTIKGRP